MRPVDADLTRCQAVVTLGAEPDTVELQCQYPEGHGDDHRCEWPGLAGYGAYYWRDGSLPFGWVDPLTVAHIRRLLEDRGA